MNYFYKYSRTLCGFIWKIETDLTVWSNIRNKKTKPGAGGENWIRPEWKFLPGRMSWKILRPWIEFMREALHRHSSGICPALIDKTHAILVQVTKIRRPENIRNPEDWTPRTVILCEMDVVSSTLLIGNARWLSDQECYKLLFYDGL